MNIEQIFRKIPEFDNIKIDTILFESKYPVLFTCKNNNDIYMFICCLVNSTKIEWIGTKTSYENLIELLQNTITIRDAFLNVTDEKIIIEYNGENTSFQLIDKLNIPEYLLPTEGEYMDAEDDEYSEEIQIFTNMIKVKQFQIKPYNSNIWSYVFTDKIKLPDEYFTDKTYFTNVINNVKSIKLKRQYSLV